MTVESNKEVVRRQFELLGSGDVDGAVALWAPESQNQGRAVDSKGLAKVYESVLALSETHALHEMVAEGEWVAVRTTCSGAYAGKPVVPVHAGTIQEAEPDGLPSSNEHVHFFKVTDGKLTEHWATRDDLGVDRQIGFQLKPPPT